MGIKFSNFIDTTIADVGGVSAVATEFTVNAGDGALFPALGVGDHCVVVCITALGAREIMHVTDVTVDTLTVVRARESTTGLVFAQDDIVQGRVTAGSLGLLDDLAGLLATEEEINAVCDGNTATAEEIVKAADGIGVTIPRQVVVEIPAWNMDTTGSASVAIPAGIAFAKVVGFSALIFNDGMATEAFPIDSLSDDLSQAGFLDMGSVAPIRITITRVALGKFDNPSFSSVAHIRGYLLVSYID